MKKKQEHDEELKWTFKRVVQEHGDKSIQMLHAPLRTKKQLLRALSALGLDDLSGHVQGAYLLIPPTIVNVLEAGLSDDDPTSAVSVLKNATVLVLDKEAQKEGTNNNEVDGTSGKLVKKYLDSSYCQDNIFTSRNVLIGSKVPVHVWLWDGSVFSPKENAQIAKVLEKIVQAKTQQFDEQYVKMAIKSMRKKQSVSAGGEDTKSFPKLIRTGNWSQGYWRKKIKGVDVPAPFHVHLIPTCTEDVQDDDINGYASAFLRHLQKEKSLEKWVPLLKESLTPVYKVSVGSDVLARLMEGKEKQVHHPWIQALWDVLELSEHHRQIYERLLDINGSIKDVQEIRPMLEGAEVRGVELLKNLVRDIKSGLRHHWGREEVWAFNDLLVQAQKSMPNAQVWSFVRALPLMQQSSVNFWHDQKVQYCSLEQAAYKTGVLTQNIFTLIEALVLLNPQIAAALEQMMSSDKVKAHQEGLSRLQRLWVIQQRSVQKCHYGKVPVEYGKEFAKVSDIWSDIQTDRMLDESSFKYSSSMVHRYKEQSERVEQSAKKLEHWCSKQLEEKSNQGQEAPVEHSNKGAPVEHSNVMESSRDASTWVPSDAVSRWQKSWEYSMEGVLQLQQAYDEKSKKRTGLLGTNAVLSHIEKALRQWHQDQQVVLNRFEHLQQLQQVSNSVRWSSGLKSEKSTQDGAHRVSKRQVKVQVMLRGEQQQKVLSVVDAQKWFSQLRGQTLAVCAGTYERTQQMSMPKRLYDAHVWSHWFGKWLEQQDQTVRLKGYPEHSKIWRALQIKNVVWLDSQLTDPKSKELFKKKKAMCEKMEQYELAQLWSGQIQQMHQRVQNQLDRQQGQIKLPERYVHEVMLENYMLWEQGYAKTPTQWAVKMEEGYVAVSEQMLKMAHSVVVQKLKVQKKDVNSTGKGMFFKQDEQEHPSDQHQSEGKPNQEYDQSDHVLTTDDQMVQLKGAKNAYWQRLIEKEKTQINPLVDPSTQVLKRRQLR